MKKMMKKILTTAMAATIMLQASFSALPVSAAEGTSVYSADFSSSKILESMTTSNLETYGKEMKVENGALVIQSKDGSTQKKMSNIDLPITATLEKDEENGTVTTTETLSGRLALEMDIEHNVNNGARWEVRPRQDAEEYGQIRFNNDKNAYYMPVNRQPFIPLKRYLLSKRVQPAWNLIQMKRSFI